MTAVAAPGDPEDDEILDRVLCRCGALASVLLVDDDNGVVTVSTRCRCGMFLPADILGGSR